MGPRQRCRGHGDPGEAEGRPGRVRPLLHPGRVLSQGCRAGQVSWTLGPGVCAETWGAQGAGGEWAGGLVELSEPSQVDDQLFPEVPRPRGSQALGVGSALPRLLRFRMTMHTVPKGPPGDEAPLSAAHRRPWPQPSAPAPCPCARAALWGPSEAAVTGQRQRLHAAGARPADAAHTLTEAPPPQPGSRSAEALGAGGSGAQGGWTSHASLSHLPA